MPEKDIMKELKAVRKDLQKVLKRLEPEQMSKADMRAYDVCMKEATEGKTVPLEQARRELQG